MLGAFGSSASAPSALITPRAQGLDRRTGAEPEAAVPAMLRELSIAAAMGSDPESAIDRARPLYRAALLAGGASMRLTDRLVGGVFHFARAIADTNGDVAAPAGSCARWRPDPDGHSAPAPTIVLLMTATFVAAFLYVTRSNSLIAAGDRPLERTT